ncbi:MAG: phenylacetate--CoA ligase [Anaerotruncus sp.]|nr:phenylacetate--CoA ligase [Anaerotruncus sp.]
MIRHEEQKWPRKKIEELQLEKVKALVARVYKNVPFYQKSFDAAGVKPKDLKNLSDLAKFPFTVKKDLRDNYPFGLFAVPMDKIVPHPRLAPGTTGKPTVVGYTQKRHRVVGRGHGPALACAGGRHARSDIIHNAYGYGLFTGGLGAHYGAEAPGRDRGPHLRRATPSARSCSCRTSARPCICCTPSLRPQPGRDHGAEPGVDAQQDQRSRAGIFGAEPWSENMRQRDRAAAGHQGATTSTACPRSSGPGVAMRVHRRPGRAAHLSRTISIAEIIDPDTGEVLPPGEKGELVLHHPHQGGLPAHPLPDAGHHQPRPRAVPRAAAPSARMERVTGRTDDMLIIRGVNVFPSPDRARAHGGRRTRAALPDHRRPRGAASTTMEVQVEVSDKLMSDEIKQLSSMTKKIEHDIKDFLGVNAKVKLVEPRTIARSEGKAKRVIDKRKI